MTAERMRITGKSMIIFLIEREALKKEIEAEFGALNIDYKFLSFQNKEYLENIYNNEQEVSGLAVELKNPFIPIDGWLDLLDSLGRRMPVIVLSDTPRQIVAGKNSRGQMLIWMQKPNVTEMLSIFDAGGLLGLSQRILNRDSIPLYNSMLGLHMLRQNGSLSMLSIHSSEFRKIAIEYGAEAYHKLQVCLQQLLYDLWGAKGSFRARDILCQTSPNSNTYYILLEQSRSEMGIPPPGSLERLADRLVTKLQNLFWHELLKPPKQRMLPSYLQIVPDFCVGHATALYNPCVDSSEALESLIETSHEIAKVQQIRIDNRRRELMQTLIQTNHLLVPFFQGVFTLKNLKNEQVEEAIRTGSIKALEKNIYSFESLIRVNAKKVDSVLQNSGPIYLEAKYLRPDVLFSMAQASHLALELDQACLKYAAREFANLPGKLMVNILPRNFYYIDQLRHLIPEGLQVIFEVSESEAINNFGLLLNAREKLNHSSKNFGIAIDDFGKGFAGLDRIIKIKPDLIKLDRSLISDIDRDLPKKAFVSGLVSASANTNSIVLAEGVERMEELEVLRDLGIDLIQGFLLHKPQSRQDIEAQLASDSSDELETVA